MISKVCIRLRIALCSTVMILSLIQSANYLSETERNRCFYEKMRTAPIVNEREREREREKVEDPKTIRSG